MSIRSRSALSRTAAALATGALVVAAPAAASAKPYEMDRYAGSTEFDDEVCGVPVHVEAEFSGHFVTRPVKGTDQAFLAHDNYRFTETLTYTDPETGAETAITTSGKGVFHEQHARDAAERPGTIDLWEFDAIDAGWFTLYGTDGQRIFRGNGVARSTVLFDTLGDGEPGGEFYEEVSFVFRGHETGDFCSAVLAGFGLAED